jgi:protein-L-isoaspartate(D-aspartate) O-methyltransferase
MKTGVDDTRTDILQRSFMVKEQLQRRHIADQRVLDVMSELPRHGFIPEEHRSEAYLDQPVPIGFGQTISQPYIVALMTQKLDVQPHHRVLEIGTGCGYQTAILAELAHKVYTIERIEALTNRTRRILAELAITNVEYQVGDGSRGWPQSLETKPESTPQFDRILAAAAAPEVPQNLLAQLADDGKMVLPVGSSGGQELLLLHKQGKKIKKTFLCYCRFVPLVSDE